MVILRSGVCHFVHVALDLFRVSDEVVHTFIEHRVRVGRWEYCLYSVDKQTNNNNCLESMYFSMFKKKTKYFAINLQFVNEMISEIGRDRLMPLLGTLYGGRRDLSRLQATRQLNAEPIVTRENVWRPAVVNAEQLLYGCLLRRRRGGRCCGCR